MTDDSDSRHHVQEIVDRLDTLTDRDHVAVSDVLEIFGPTAFVPIMMIPAFLVVSPLSGIPLFSSFCGITVALISGQVLLGRRELRLPGFIRRQTIAGERLHDGIVRMRGLANWIDRHARDRFSGLVGGSRDVVAFGLCFLAGAAMPFLEVVPFSSSILGMAILFFSVGILTRDGLFVLMGAGIMAVASLIPITVYLGLT